MEEDFLQILIGPKVFVKAKTIHRHGVDHYVIKTDSLAIDYKRDIKGWRPIFSISINGHPYYEIYLFEQENVKLKEDIISFWNTLGEWELKYSDDWKKRQMDQIDAGIKEELT